MKGIDMELLVMLASTGTFLIGCALWGYWRHRRDMKAAGVQIWPPPPKIVPKEPRPNVEWRGLS